MRHLLISLVAVYCVMTFRGAMAQEFWYQLSGNSYGYNYVIPLGGAVGLNYGYGTGSGQPFESALAIRLTDFGQFPRTDAAETTHATISTENDEQQEFVSAKKPKKKAALPVLHSKPMPLSKQAKGTKASNHSVLSVK